MENITLPIMGSTPRKVRNAVNTTNLETTRAHLLDEVGDIQLYPMEDFFGTLLPPVTDMELNRVKKELSIKSSKSWLVDRMQCAKPSLSNTHESVTFAPIARIFNAVANAVQKLGIGPSVMMLKDDPTKSPQGDVTYNTRPDACYCLRKSRVEKPAETRVDTLRYRKDRDCPKDISWADSPGTEEYKKDRKQWRDNVRKVVTNMCQVIAHDPCRRAVFALTYEDSFVRFWWCDRSGFAASDDFDYFEDFDMLLRLYISLSKADETRLGYDPTMMRTFVDSKEQFLIRFTGEDRNGHRVEEIYRTVSCLSNVGAGWVVGRGTRVWKVERLNRETMKPDGTIKVLKDVWLERTRVIEGQRYRAIAKWFHDHPDHLHMARHFFTFYADCYVEVDGVMDSTFQTIRGGLLPETPDDKQPPRRLAVLADQTYSLAIYTKSVGPVTAISRTLRARVAKGSVDRCHSRLLIDEVGRRMDELRVLGDVFECLIGANRALEALQLMGIVHRDVSPGNIMWVDGVGKLGDLEFCMEYLRTSSTDVTRHEELTGTPFFMSDEVLRGGYSWVEEPAEEIDFFFESPQQSSPFIQNYLHDAESLWWVMIWFLVLSYPLHEITPQDAINARIEIAEKCFPLHDLKTVRLDHMSNPFHTARVLAHPHPSHIYAPFFQLVRSKWRSILIARYKQAQKNQFEFDSNAMNNVHREVGSLLSEYAEKAKEVACFAFFTDKEEDKHNPIYCPLIT